jgi:hypothetical protein
LNNTGSTYYETVIGVNALLNTGSTSSFNTGDTIFRIGIGSAIGSKADAFRVYKSGKIEITQKPNSGTTENNVLVRTATGEIQTVLAKDLIAQREKFGELTVVPDSVTSTFTFAHGMTGTPTVIGSRKSDPLANLFETSSDATNIIISFPLGAPIAGSNIVISYIAKL